MYAASPSSPPVLRLDSENSKYPRLDSSLECDEKLEDMHGVFKNPNPNSNKSSQESGLNLEEAPTDLRRRRILPSTFFNRNLEESDPESSDPEGSDAEDSDAEDPATVERDRGTLARMKVACEIVFGDINDRQAENRRENADYYEGDTPRTSQESQLSDYLWSRREGGDFMPLDHIIEFVFKYLPRSRIFTRVAPFVAVTEELYERDPGSAMDDVAHVLDCEPALLFNVLEDAIEIAEDMLRS